MSKRRRFPKISPLAFQHPLDAKALEAVKKAKGVDYLVRKINEYGYERYLYINNIADNVRVGPRQCPQLYNMLVEACEILDVEIPQLYITQDPMVNAFTFGSESPFIIINSGMIDLMSDDELLAIIAHEVGHIKCGHVLYKMVASFLRVAAEVIADVTLGIGKLIAGPLLVAFYEWDRKSELTADRAGLLVVQDKNVSINALMKLAGGSTKVYEQFNREEFLRQAEDYVELDHSMLNQFYKLIQVLFRSHPFPALRAREINTWADSMEYKNICNGIYPRVDVDFSWSPSYSSTTCPHCNVHVEPNANFCQACGAALHSAIAVIEKRSKRRCSTCETPLRPSDDFCPNCGMNTRFDW
ncbi:MAG: M48 family metallopeptidase [Acidobacteriota bacterium]|nr:M48 family metallopeptidase [Blastocatellia bacterium]MDW8412181.1 M48 family metallopeptidase [Acidobacteriota bacterium]